MTKIRPNSNSKAGSARYATIKGGNKGAGSIRKHYYRIGDQPENVDASRIDENILFIEPTMTIPECRNRCNELKRQRHERSQSAKSYDLTELSKPKPKWRALRNDVSPTGQVIVTFGSELNDQVNAILDGPQCNEFLGDLTKMVEEHFDTEITGGIVHRDEEQPHIHFEVLSIANNGLAITKISDRQHMRDFQTRVFEVLQKYVPDVERGNSKIDMRGPDYRSPQELREETLRDVAAIEAQIADLNKKLEKANKRNEKAQDKLLRAQIDESATAANVDRLQKRADDYQARADKLKDEIEERKAEIEKRENAVADQEGEIAERQNAVADQEADIEQRTKAAADLEADLNNRKTKLEYDETFQTVRKEGLDARDKEIGERESALEHADVALDMDRIELQKQADEVARKESDLIKREEALVERETSVGDRETSVADRETSVSERETSVGDRETSVSSHEGALKVQDSLMKTRERALNKREASLNTRESELTVREQAVKQAQAALDTMFKGVKAIVRGVLRPKEVIANWLQGPKASIDEAKSVGGQLSSEIRQLEKFEEHWAVLRDLDKTVHGATGSKPAPKSKPSPAPKSDDGFNPGMGM